MKILFDTNIVLDVLACREPFFENSQAIIRLVAEGKIEGAISANSVTDIYYILRKHLDPVALRVALRGLMELLDVADVTVTECLNALDLPMNDYEDAVLACCAQGWKADCIVTRNEKDFLHSPIPALSPVDFLKSVDFEMQDDH